MAVGAPVGVVMGVAQAGVFPMLIAITPERVGPAHVANAIGFQVAAAGVGLAVLPGLAGVLAQDLGLEIIGLFIIISGVLWLILYEVSLRWIGAQRSVPG